ncbi:efflux RND transporter periplasmic adaptor subunit [Caviibacterium pharyngocola]|uniref:Efflux transporter periplasmic adaptor subunit n=1 Tax=Caviibacterium pharyngocola TaxID=28159 RepID=A0A2M8RYW5_9PAST|nr:efflux RND transporter periplasmic adaptor subunit [Caviibacterium pharyngocola]PJG84064.1 efflux transporter periplasmic adaptor subunit [Caviibacterium pharyngocola]
MTKKSLFVLALAAVIGFGAYYYLASSNNTKITYLTETVKRGDLQKSVITGGTVRAYNRVEVGAQASGKIEKIYVTLGQEIKQGDLIAEIDSKTQVNNLNIAQAELLSYQAQLKAKKVAYEVAKSAYSRMSALYNKKSASLDDLNNAKDNFASAEAAIEEIEASIKKAEIEVDSAKTNLEYTKIHSPLDGTVISIPVSEGQTVNANQTTPTIVQVADLNKILIKPEISEGDVTKVKAGMPVTFTTLSDPDTVYKSTISSVDPAMSTLTDNEYSESVSDTNAVYYYANVVVDNKENKLRIGMSVQNTIIIADVKDTLLVPTMTLHKQNNKTFVNVLTAEDKAEQREVKIGLNDDVNTQILDGVQEGEKVISSQVADGEKVGNSARGPRMF